MERIIGKKIGSIMILLLLALSMAWTGSAPRRADNANKAATKQPGPTSGKELGTEETEASSDGNIWSGFRFADLVAGEDVNEIMVLAEGSSGLLDTVIFQEKNQEMADRLAKYDEDGHRLSFRTLTADGYTYYVDSTAAFSEFIGQKELSGAVLYLMSDIEINGDVLVENPFTWKLNGHTFSTEGQLEFRSYEAGAMQIDNEREDDIRTAGILALTPAWDYTVNIAPAGFEESVWQYMNVRSYNGKMRDANLGGIGKSTMTSCVLKDRDGHTADVSIDGYYASVSLSYAQPLDIERAALEAHLSDGGTGTIINENGQYYIRITDANGDDLGYRLDVSTAGCQLPVIHISTKDGDGITSRDTYKNGTFSIDYNGYMDIPAIEGADMQIRGRGHSSWDTDKKPYKIKFDKKTSLFGLTKAKDWVLIANHTDRTLMRNIVAMSMGSVLDNMLFIPHAYPVDLFVNGRYAGVYSLSEQVEVKDGRIPGEKDGTAVDTDYLLELGGKARDTAWGTDMFRIPTQDYVEVKNPSNDKLTEEQFSYIKAYMEAVDDSVEKLDGYEEYMDVDSLIDWFLLNEFTYNLDCSLRRSNFLLKKAGDKLYFASPWDFDYAFGNFWRDSADFDEWICLGNANTENYIKTNWITYLIEDEAFTEKLRKRWEEVGAEMYQAALTAIDENERLIAESAKENFKLWPDCFGKKIQYENSKTAAIKSYEGQVDYLREFVKNRYKWMDRKLKETEGDRG